MDDAQAPFDRALLVRRRGRVASGAADVDFLLQRVAGDMVERVAVVQRSFPLAADIGAHHGVLARALVGAENVGTVISVDAAAPLLAGAPGPKLVADEEALPFADGSLDLAVSALSLQLVNDLPGTLAQIRRALKPDGMLLAAMLGGATLTELRQAWLAAEAEVEGGASPRVAPFVDVRQAGALLQRAGFALPVVDSETLTVTYASPLALMREIKAMGVSNMLLSRRRQPVRRETLARAAAIYAGRFGTSDGRVPATFEIVTMTAWVPHDSQPRPLEPGSAQVSLAQVLGKPAEGTRER